MKKEKTKNATLAAEGVEVKVFFLLPLPVSVSSPLSLCPNQSIYPPPPLTCAASEISRIAKSDSASTSKTSPSVRSFSLKPQARASSADAEPERRPMETFWEF